MFSAFGGEDFSNEPVFARFDELPKAEILSFEKEVAGIYMSGHPLDEYRDKIQALNYAKCGSRTGENEDETELLSDGQAVTICAIISKRVRRDSCAEK